MQSNYNDSLTRVLKDEGGYSNDPHDPGGPTNYGITLNDYRLYINSNGQAEDVKNMSLDQAKTIYKSKYWDAQNCDQLPSGLDYVVFDYGVNSGIGRSTKVLQRKVGVAADGKIGPATIAAVNKQDKKQLINAICDERMAFLKGLSTWQYYGKGWTNRVEGGRKFALALADKTAGTTAGPGTVIVGGAGAAAAAPTQWVPWIIGGTLVLALVIGIGIYIYNKRKINNVETIPSSVEVHGLAVDQGQVEQTGNNPSGVDARS